MVTYLFFFAICVTKEKPPIVIGGFFVFSTYKRLQQEIV